VITTSFCPTEIISTSCLVSFPSATFVFFEVSTGFVPTTIIFTNGFDGNFFDIFASFTPSCNVTTISSYMDFTCFVTSGHANFAIPTSFPFEAIPCLCERGS